MKGKVKKKDKQHEIMLPSHYYKSELQKINDKYLSMKAINFLRIALQNKARLTRRRHKEENVRPCLTVLSL